ncbi:cystathionine gamma-lyase-like [Sycon ciliatum]|uniref:cystathionine gamma-lyase-like n=1 Tax=Sycon ciliatum TaxID=27933 RepID=UPI0031F60D15
MAEPSAKRSPAEASEEGFPHFATQAIHSGQDPDQWRCQAMIPLISLSTTFKQNSPAVLSGGYEYTRGGNPTRKVYEDCLAACENAKYALSFSSGLASCMSVINTLSSGDHIVCCDDVYGGTNRYLNRVVARMGITTSMVDCSNADNVAAAIKPNTKLVWIESPTNPLLKLCDIKAVADAAHSANKDIIVVTDNTFMSSYFQHPLDLGADIVMHSITKYMNGHGDVLGGALCMNSKDLYDKLYFVQYAVGAVQSPFDCYMANRGLKTLAVRMKQHQKNAFAVARFLEAHSRVERVVYPGLPSHPQHELACRQGKGFGGMVVCFIKGGLEQSKTFLSSLKVFTLAESLGGFESLAELPSRMTHASITQEERTKLGISDTLIRLSVGLEEEEDLLTDLEQALKKAVPDSLL